VFMNVGVCPQSDCLWDELNTEDHIKLFSKIIGLSSMETEANLSFFLENMNLTEYRYRRAKELSGGNRRKLCAAIALIGGPSIILLDEPSSGLDPFARRKLLIALHSFVEYRNSAIIFTSHSMDEAEAICNKIGIRYLMLAKWC